MSIIAIIIIIFIFIKTIFYGIYEIKENKNYTAGIYTIVLSTVALIFPIIEIIIHH